MIDRPEWHGQPYGEIVLDDCYRLKTLGFTPDLVFDIGANLGCFSARVADLWPDARIAAIEPHADNCRVLREVLAELPQVDLEIVALGNKPIWFQAGPNPGRHVFACESLGFTEEQLRREFQAVEIPFTTLAEFAARHPPTDRTLIKIDIEGAERCLFDDAASSAVLRAARYFTMELHMWGNPPADASVVRQAYVTWLAGFSDTHNVTMEMRFPGLGGMAWATKRNQ